MEIKKRGVLIITKKKINDTELKANDYIIDIPVKHLIFIYYNNEV